MQKRNITYVLLTIVIVITIAVIMLYNSRANAIAPAKDAIVMLQEGEDALMSNNMAQAYGYLSQALAAFRERGQDEYIFESTVYMALLYHTVGLRQESYQILKQLPYRETDNPKSFSTQYYLRLMSYYTAFVDSDFAASLELTRRLLDYDTRTYDDPSMTYMDKANLAETYIKMGDAGKARQLLDDVESRPLERYTFYMSQVCYCRGLILFDEGKTDAAYAEWDKGVGWARKWDGTEDIAMNMSRMIAVDSLRGNLASYTTHRNEVDSIRKATNGTELKWRIAVMEEQHKMAILEQKAARTKTVAILLCVIIASLVTLIVLVIKRYGDHVHMSEMALREKDMRIQQEALEHELMELRLQQSVQQLAESHNTNVQLSRQLANKEGPSGRESRLETVDKTFRSANTDFVRRMEERFPHLTRNDMTLISLIMLGMKSQDMASLLGISQESLRKNRYRLRKKLEIQGDDDIRQFLGNLQ